MATARVIITKAMQKVGILVKSEVPDADEANDAFDALNMLIDSWSNFSNSITSRTRETFTLSSAISYSIGSGQTFNTVRPTQIIEAFVSQGGVDYPMQEVNQELYDSVTFKTTTGRPQFFTYNNGFPNGTIMMYPVPDASYTITILSEKPISTFATLDTSSSLPAGWERALVYNLALELAPEYGQQPDASIVDIARKSLGAIKLSVVRSRPVQSDNNDYVIGNVYNGWST